MFEYAPNRCCYPSRRLNQVSTPGACPVLESAGSSALQLLIIYAQTVHIQKFDGIGTLKGMWGSKGSSLGELNKPEDIAINNKTGEVFITDTQNSRVQVFHIE